MGCLIDAHGLIRSLGVSPERLQLVANSKIAAALYPNSSD